MRWELLVLSGLVLCVAAWDNDDLEVFDVVEEVNQNFYELMGVSQEASQSEIKSAFRQLTLKLHPDKSDAPDADVQFRNLVSVHNILKDPGKREKYNEVLKNGLPNWRSAVYYYRHVRKMGLAEGAIILFIITTFGQYLVGWASYFEKRYTAEQILNSKTKKTKKSGFDSAVNEILDQLPKPSIWNTLPFQIPMEEEEERVRLEREAALAEFREKGGARKRRGFVPPERECLLDSGDEPASGEELKPVKAAPGREREAALAEFREKGGARKRRGFVPPERECLLDSGDEPVSGEELKPAKAAPVSSLYLHETKLAKFRVKGGARKRRGFVPPERECLLDSGDEPANGEDLKPVKAAPSETKLAKFRDKGGARKRRGFVPPERECLLDSGDEPASGEDLKPVKATPVSLLYLDKREKREAALAEFREKGGARKRRGFVPPERECLLDSGDEPASGEDLKPVKATPWGRLEACQSGTCEFTYSETKLAKFREKGGARKRRGFVPPERESLLDSGDEPASGEDVKPVKAAPAPPVITGGLWTDDDLAELVRLVKKFPGGTPERWERIAEAMCRSVGEVTHMAAKMKENCYKVPGQEPEPVVVEPPKKVKTRKTEEVPAGNWSQPQQAALEAALAKHPKGGAGDRWQKIASAVPGKTKEECMARCRYLSEMVKKQKQQEEESQSLGAATLRAANCRGKCSRGIRSGSPKVMLGRARAGRAKINAAQKVAS
ncbi:dnaJ domain-containing protein [Phthorimaea operculella]|nr:dnaJ domain-containing protein [Phthorimaea operculella]